MMYKTELPPLNILSVDDDESNLFVIRELIEPLGYEVVDASSGREAIALAERDEFALFLLDVMRPELDGLDTLERLRDKPKAAATPVILITRARQYLRRAHPAQAALTPRGLDLLFALGVCCRLDEGDTP